MNALGETNGKFVGGKFIVLPRYGIYYYGDKPTEWITDDEEEIEKRVRQLNDEGVCCCVSDGDPPVWRCSCGRRHFNGTSDYCNSCLQGD